MRLCDLRQKEVINICDGNRVGYVADVDFDMCNCTVNNIIIPGPNRLFGIFGNENEYIIPVCCIRQIGHDVILVEANLEKCLKKCYD